MKSAGDAMKQIHGGMSLEQVDETMYVMRAREMSDTELETWNLGRVCLLMIFLQGQTPRTTSSQPGDWRRYHEHPAG